MLKLAILPLKWFDQDVCIAVCVCVCLSVYIWLCVCLCIYDCVCVSVYIWLCVCVCVCVQRCVYRNVTKNKKDDCEGRVKIVKCLFSFFNTYFFLLYVIISVHRPLGQLAGCTTNPNTMIFSFRCEKYYTLHDVSTYWAFSHTMLWLFLTLNERDIDDINPNLKKTIILDFSSLCFKSNLSNLAWL